MSLSHRYFEHKKPRVEVVPMIDIMMFLLIFFMLIMLKMIEASGIPLTLPNSNSAEKIEQLILAMREASNGSSTTSVGDFVRPLWQPAQ